MDDSAINRQLADYLLENAIEQSPDGIIIVAMPEGRIIIANSAALQIRGKTDVPLMGISIPEHSENWNVFNPDETPCHYKDLPLTRALTNGETINNVLLIIRTDDGENRWIRVNASPVKDKCGKIIAAISVFRDVTAEKNRDQHIVWLSRMIEHIGEGVLVLDNKAYIVFINSAGAKMHGYEVNELIGKHSDIFHNEEQLYKTVPEFIKQVHEKGIHSGELEDVHKNGTVFPVWVTASVYYDDTGKPAGLIAVAADITKRKQYEEDLKREKNFISAIFKHSYDGIAVANKNGDIKAFSPGMEKIFGVKFSEIKNMYQLGEIIIPYNNTSALMRQLWNFDIDSGIPSERIVEFIRSDGQKRWCRLQMSQMSDDEFVINGQDITDRKILEENLKNERDRFQKYLDICGVIIMVILNDGRVSAMNKKGCEILGYSEYEIIGKNWFDNFVPSEFKEKGWKMLRSFFTPQDKRTSGSHENKIITKSGDVRIIRWDNIVLHDNDGKPYALLSSGTDITELRKLTEELADNVQELKRSNYELEQYAYVASHDLQEPVRNLLKYLELINMENKGKLDRKTETFIERAIINADRMQNLIKSLLVFSQVDRKKTLFKNIKLTNVLKNVLTDIRLIIKENNARIMYDSLPEIIADETQIFQLLQNIIINAIKFKSDKPPKINISATQDGSEWVFAVSDNGIGIEEKYLSRIFLMFERLDKSKSVDGAGIGLAMCKRIVEHHGGRIWVKSKSGEGTTIYFSLPINLSN